MNAFRENFSTTNFARFFLHCAEKADKELKFTYIAL